MRGLAKELGALKGEQVVRGVRQAGRGARAERELLGRHPHSVDLLVSRRETVEGRGQGGVVGGGRDGGRGGQRERGAESGRSHGGTRRACAGTSRARSNLTGVDLTTRAQADEEVPRRRPRDTITRPLAQATAEL